MLHSKFLRRPDGCSGHSHRMHEIVSLPALSCMLWPIGVAIAQNIAIYDTIIAIYDTIYRCLIRSKAKTVISDRSATAEPND